MKPLSDLVLQIASTSDVAKTRAATYTGALVDLRHLSPTTIRFAIEIPNRADLAFLPGQYVNIAVPGTDETRSYSFSNGPDEHRLTFLVKLTPGGVMSRYLDICAALGDSITFTGPHGSFFVREAGRPILMLAGGTDLAPMLAMLRKMCADAAPRQVHLIYGITSDYDVVALDELREIAAALPGFTWEYCVADLSTQAANQGVVTTLIRPAELYEGDAAIYLCGPPAMVESVRSHINTLGIEPTGFYYEKFALAHAGAAATTSGSDPAPARIFVEDVLLAPEARAVAGQVVLAGVHLVLRPHPIAVSADRDDPSRYITGQMMAPAAGSAPSPLDADDGALLPTAAREVVGQTLFSEPKPKANPPRVVHAPVTADGYQIGEEHPAVHDSDAIFEAREALELGALELRARAGIN